MAKPARIVLVTGFEPFGGDRYNPSQVIAESLHGRRVRGRRVHGAVLPCVFGDSLRCLESLLTTVNPELIVCLGLASARAAITPERVAINLDDARIPDNAGRQPIDQPIVAAGPAAYWSTLPVKAIVAELSARKLPAAVSQSAGTFVCNHVFYGLMDLLARPEHQGRLGGFIHVPAAARNGRGWRAPRRLTEGIAGAIETALRVRRDLAAVGGAIA